MSVAEVRASVPVWEIVQGDCVDVLREFPDNSIDAIVTDPPYGLSEHKTQDVEACLRAWLAGEEYRPKKKGFMGQAWDAWVPGPECWRECLRVLKPGGCALVFAGSRTDDLMGIVLWLAGFRRRDLIGWLTGQGFPKSLDVSKAINKAAGAEREVVGEKKVTRIFNPEDVKKHNYVGAVGHAGSVPVTAPATPEAAAWDGWGTALKPALEPVILVQKPFVGTVAQNVLAHGTGALNIDGCRIGAVTGDREDYGLNGNGKAQGGFTGDVYGECDRPLAVYRRPEGGRWPANVALDEEVAAELDRQSGIKKSGVAIQRNRDGKVHNKVLGARRCPAAEDVGFGDVGGASRFFYCAKSSTKERNAGVDGKNTHPTVKPLDLMRWLVRLVTPPGGLIIDPFCGSGTTICAAVLEGFDAYGIDQDEVSVETARRRVAYWESQR